LFVAAAPRLGLTVDDGERKVIVVRDDDRELAFAIQNVDAMDCQRVKCCIPVGFISGACEKETSESMGLSRSAYIARLAERDAGPASGKAMASVKAALESLDRLLADASADDSTAAVRADRDGR